MSCAQIISGELHYPRIPRPYWRERLRMARAMGLNAISAYVFWNVHETQPQQFDFSGEKDVAAFLRIAQQEELGVILRPGPYVCAEWDLGGLPYWLLRNDSAGAIRTVDESYMTPVRRWLRRLGEELAPLTAASGGPIIAVQIENEYGAYGRDKSYLTALRSALIEAGLGTEPFFTIDQPGDLAAGSLPNIPIAVTFAPGDPAQMFERFRAVRAGAPFLVGEYWAGWFDHWGEAREPLDPLQQVNDLRWMLQQGASVNIYMFHGGTNFGFWNGANDSQSAPYQPTITSYDYEAALDEAGRPTAKYHAFRETIANVTGAEPPPVPQTRAAIDVPEFALTFAAPLMDAADEWIECDVPISMEELGQAHGFVLYRTAIEGAFDAMLRVEEVRDYAVVMIEGAIAARLDRRLGERSVRITSTAPRTQLDILVENCGRINYGASVPSERKGITGGIFLGERELRSWKICSLPLETIGRLRFARTPAPGPVFYRGYFDVDEPGDTFFETADLGKGVLWINGRNAGRFWNVGPQQALYVPGCWLEPGRNEAVVLDLFEHSQAPKLRGVSERPH